MLILAIDTSGGQGSVALLRAPDLQTTALREEPPGQLRKDAAESLSPVLRDALPADLRTTDLPEESRKDGSRVPGLQSPALPEELRDPAAELTTLELASLSGRHYSELLVSTIAGLLQRHGLSRSAIGLIAVASGPGSFTGLRVAIATTKGLAEPFATPVVAVSVLEAVAAAAARGPSGPYPTTAASASILAALDAQRSEIFYGHYLLDRAAPQPARCLREGISSFADFLALRAFSDPRPAVFTPDEALAGRLRQAGVDTHLLTRPSAPDYARIAYAKFLAGLRADLLTLDANYLRRSDAEIFAQPKSGTPASTPARATPARKP